MTKIWQKSTSKHLSWMHEFTVGKDREMDLYLMAYDIQASKVHAEMLCKQGFLTQQELHALQSGFVVLERETSAEDFTIPAAFEDIHSYLEFRLTEICGDAGKKIHTGRSRNDQVLTAMRLFLKHELLQIKTATKTLVELTLQLANDYQSYLLPGYTHTQVAMPSSFGLWYTGWAEALVDDLQMLEAALKVIDANPLGTAAGYGTSLPIDRDFTTHALGFSRKTASVVHAQISRGKHEQMLVFALQSIAQTLAKWSNEIVLFCSQNFAFLELPEFLTTGSSIMPHKKNPDVFELIRAKCNAMQGKSASLFALSTNLMSGYHRDFQIIKEIVFPCFSELHACLEIKHMVLPDCRPKNNIMQDPKYALCFSVEELHRLVAEGMTFRDAYQKVGEDISEGKMPQGDCGPLHPVNHLSEAIIALRKRLLDLG
jgi:argininosuccinate lyase